MAMTLSAIMNLTGNFAAQMQKNAQAMQGMAQQASQAGNTIRGSLSENIGQKMASGLAVAKDALGAAGVASAGFLKSCVTSAAGAQKINSDLAQTIKSTGGAAGMTADEVSKMASEMSKTNLASAGMIKDGDNMLLTFTNIGKDVFPQATQAMVDMAQKMGGAPKDSAIQLGKALNDPANGLTALTRVGVTFTDAQKKQVQAMQAAGDVAGAQKVILGELNKEFGGQSQAALNNYSGQMEKFSQTVGGIKSAIGSVLLPYLTTVAQKLNEGAQVVSKFANEHKTLIAVILSVTAVFGTLIGGASLFNHMTALLGPNVTLLTGLIGGLTGPILIVIAAIAALVYAYVNDFGGIKTFVEGVIGSIVTAFQGATDAFNRTGSAITAISAFIGSLFGDDAADTAADVLNRIQDIVMSLVQTVKAHIPEIKAVISSVFSAIGSVWNSVLKPVLTFIIEMFIQVVRWVFDNWPLISKTISNVMNAISSVVSTVLTGIEAFWSAHGATILAVASNIWNAIKTFITTAITVIEDIITAVMQAINGDWSGAWNSICDAVSSIFGGAVNIIQDIINSIGAIFADIATTAYNWGKDMIDGIVNGIKGAIGDVENAVSGVADTITKYIHFSRPDVGSLRNYEEWMPDFMQGLGDGIKVNTHLVTDPIKDLSVGIKTNTLGGLQGTNIPVQSTASKGGSGNRIFQIAKLADHIIVREDADIDKIATALANKLTQTELGMA
ncbi:hypothetical protein [Clostridium sp.]|uniref:phage tail protein n=1 Tax=Clostridium sp. TaxID=1506 RepID=UPI0028473848|nr:hypothetical protein [Clostridium sp.]MDR3595098.1 hypothetical protein [Clostridium sp.]